MQFFRLNVIYCLYSFWRMHVNLKYITDTKININIKKIRLVFALSTLIKFRFSGWLNLFIFNVYFS